MAQVGTAGADEAAPETVSPAHLPRSATDPSAVPSMVIRTGQASLRVDSLEPAVARVRQLAQRVGGFIANSQMQAGENQLRSATLEIRVPASRFDDLTGGLPPIGRVEYVNVSAEDVGEEFTDITARATNAHRLEQRLIDLLATRTGKLSDVLEIERELARVRESIERMEGRLRYLQAHVATSTLSVTVHEEAPLVGNTGSGSVLGEAFRRPGGISSTSSLASSSPSACWCRSPPSESRCSSGSEDYGACGATVEPAGLRAGAPSGPRSNRQAKRSGDRLPLAGPRCLRIVGFTF